MLFALVLAACHGAPDDAEDGVPSYTISPPQGGRGRRLTLHLDADRSLFAFGETRLRFEGRPPRGGPERDPTDEAPTAEPAADVTVLGVTVRDGYHADADIRVASDAVPGFRDAVVTIDGLEYPLDDGFEVVAESFSLSPDHARMGEALDVRIAGRDTRWDGAVWPSFGDDVEVLAFEVLSPTQATARIAVRPDALPGARDVHMADPDEVLTRYDGFVVGREVLTAAFSPSIAWQGISINYAIEGVGTDFAADARLRLRNDLGRSGDIEVTRVEVPDGSHITGQLVVSNNARLGTYDLWIDQDDGSVLVPDALTVLDAPPDLDRVTCHTRLDVERLVGESPSEQVIAEAYCVVPSDPPCGSSPPPADGPMPYDLTGVFPVPDSAASTECPQPETVSAGDFVWLEGPENVVTLAKTVTDLGQILYVGRGLTLADYRFGTTYALHTAGDPDGVPEVYVPDVQPTVPSDYALLTPDFDGLYAPRTEPLAFTWTPAGTYPDALLFAGLWSHDTVADRTVYIGALPWDDGAYAFDPALLSRLDAGPTTLYLQSYIKGHSWQIPGSAVASSPSTSEVRTGAPLVLE